MRGAIALLALASLALVSPAAEAKPKIGLSSPTPQLRNELTALLETHGEVISDRALHGKQGPPKGAKQRPSWAKALQASAGVDSVVVADYKGKKLKVITYADGRSLGAVAIVGVKGGLDGSQRATLERYFAEKFAPSLSAPPVVTQAPAPVDPVLEAPPPPAAPAEAPIAEPVEAEKKGAPVAGRGEGPGLLAQTFGTPRDAMPFALVRVEFNSVTRRYDYNDPVTTNLRPFTANFMPVPTLSLSLYPLGLTGSAALSALGIDVGFGTSLGVSSKRDNGPGYPTTYTRFDVGLHYRLWFGDGPQSFTLIPKVGFQSAGLSLGTSSTGVTENELPNASYSGLHFGLGLDTPLVGSLRLQAEGRFVLVGSKGGDVISAAYFQAGSVNGLYASAGLALGVADNLSVELGATYQHYFFAFSPTPGDAFVAGGALDQYTAGRAALVLAL